MKMRALPVLLAAALVCALAPAALASESAVKRIRIHYRAHNGVVRDAWVLLPSWYRPGENPPLPLVISPHGRGVTALANAKLWGSLPAEGPFAVISPDGEGRKLALYSWGAPGQIADLARMPSIVSRTLPWVHVNHRRIYAVGGSMGGQETLLLLARDPKLLAGAAAFDAVADFALQYNAFTRLRCNAACHVTWHGPLGRALQKFARREIGGSPSARPEAYAERSPDTFARRIADSCVPLELWWSVKDKIVLDQRRQTGAFYDRLLKLNPDAPVEGFWGYWSHSAEMRPDRRLPVALAALGLIPPVSRQEDLGMHVLLPASFERGCTGS